jgi:hypothetical protein
VDRHRPSSPQEVKKVKRTLPARVGLVALALAALCGCAAVVRPLSVDEELARPDAPILRRGQAIAGYFDGHGLYHRTDGSIRRAKTSNDTLELRQPAGLMRTRTTRLPVDSVRTVITRRDSGSPYPGLALSVASYIYFMVRR